MFNTSLQQTAPNSFWFTKALAPLIAISLVTAAASVEARPIVIIDSPQLPTTQVIGSPIPSPIPLVPGTNIPYIFSPYYNNRDYNTVIVPGSNIINNSTLLNPRIINPRGLMILF